MSWNTSGLLVSGLDDPALLTSTLDLQPTGEVFDWEEAAAVGEADHTCLASLPGWHCLLDSTYEYAYAALCEPGSEAESRLKALSRGRTVLAFVVAGLADVYGFCLYVDGAVARRWLSTEFVLDFNEGVPLPAEQGLFSDDPDVEDTDILNFADRFGSLFEFEEATFSGWCPR